MRGSISDYTAYMYSIQAHTSVRRENAQKAGTPRAARVAACLGRPFPAVPSRRRPQKRYAPSSRCSLLRRLPLAAGGAMFWPPVGEATRSNGRCALPHPSAPQEAWRCAASAAALCSRHGQSAQSAADWSVQRPMRRRRWGAPEDALPRRRCKMPFVFPIRRRNDVI